eukprot:2030284-Amphidinium_carterae.1
MEVQCDLLFWRRFVVLHMLDTLIRWSVAVIVQTRETADILHGITHAWVRQYGPMKRLTCDHEGALDSDQGRAWATRWSIDLHFRPRGSHARMVERHNDLLRRQLHLVDEQLERDGVAVPPEAILDESVLAKNCLLAITGGISPYKALYGRAPPILMDMEPVSVTALEDEDDGIEGISRRVHRLRELSVQAVASSSAAERVERTMRSKTRPSGMVLDLSAGDVVDYWREPSTRDASGWRGPARVVNSRVQEGMVDVEWQGRTLSVRLADVRRALHPMFVAPL